MWTCKQLDLANTGISTGGYAQKPPQSLDLLLVEEAEAGRAAEVLGTWGPSVALQPKMAA